MTPGGSAGDGEKSGPAARNPGLETNVSAGLGETAGHSLGVMRPWDMSYLTGGKRKHLITVRFKQCSSDKV